MEKYLKHLAYKDEFIQFEKEYPGFFKFLDELQVGKIIKFKQLKFGKIPHDWTIKIVYREEVGIRGRTNGVGCIEYGNVLLDGSFSDLHNNGYFPCQTFMSMRDWFRYSDSYEIIK